MPRGDTAGHDQLDRIRSGRGRLVGVCFPDISVFLFLANVILLIRQKGLEKVSEPNGMTAYNDVLLGTTGRKDKIAKFAHSLEPVGSQGLVSRMEGHVDLIQVDGLEVGQFGRLVNPRGLNLSVGRGNGQGVRIATDFL